MKIIENNYKEKNKPKVVTCEFCDSKFECDENDIDYGTYGIQIVTCPCCKKEVWLDDGKELTVDNLEFPSHFYHFCTDNGANDIDDNEIINKIRKGIEYFRKNKDEWTYVVQAGTLSIIMFRHDGDGDYYVIVTKDYFDTYIPFENIDYKGNIA